MATDSMLFSSRFPIQAVGFYAALGFGSPSLAGTCVGRIGDWAASRAALMPAAEALSLINSPRAGAELAALLDGTSRHPHPQHRVADIFRNSPANALNTAAHIIGRRGPFDFSKSPPGALAHARSICGTCVDLNLFPQFERLVAGGLTLFSKALNFEETMGILLRHVRPISSIGDLVADRIACGPRYAHGIERKKQLGELTFRSPGGREFPFVYHERAEPYGLLKGVFLDEWYMPSVDLGDGPLTIFDCGGHIGVATAWLLEKYPRAMIHVFEPGRRNISCLGVNIACWRASERVLIVEKGLWSDSGTKTLHMHSLSSVSDSFFPEWISEAHLKDGSAVVAITRLDEYMRDYGIKAVDFIKMNIEGAELEALRGLGKRIKGVHVIAGDLHLAIVSEAELSEFMKASGFSLTLYYSRDKRHALFEAVNRNWKG